MDMLEREGKQATQGLYHNLNTLESRQGSQVPFTSINLGGIMSKIYKSICKMLIKTEFYKRSKVIVKMNTTNATKLHLTLTLESNSH